MSSDPESVPSRAAQEAAKAEDDSAWYRLRQFTVRHRALVGGVAVTFLALVLGIVGTGIALARSWDAEKETSDTLRRTRDTEARQRVELARTHALAAPLTAQRGQWQAAIDHYTKALDLGHEDEIALRLGRLNCLLALAHFPRARAELEALGQRSDLGRYQGQVRLHQSLAALSSGEKQAADPLEMVRQALAKGLPPADEAYARAFLAKDLPEATQHLLRAVELDPYHFLAVQMLAPLLILQGRIGEAREVVARATLVMPSSTSLLFIQAMILALDGDVARAQQLISKAAPTLGPDMTAVGHFLAKLFHRMTQEDFLWKGITPEERRSVLLEMTLLAPRLSRMVGDSGVSAWGDFGFGRLPFFKDVHSLLNPVGMLELVTNAGGQVDTIGKVADTMQEGTFYRLHGLLLKDNGRLAEAEEAFRRAVQAPSISRCQRRALYDLILVQWQQSEKAEGAHKQELRSRALSNVRQLATQGPLPTLAYGELIYIAHMMGDGGLALALCEAWERQAPDDHVVSLYRLHVEWDLQSYERVRRTAAEVLKHAPADVGVLAMRARAELRSGAVSAALATAHQVLKKEPRNAVAANLDSEARNLVTAYKSDFRLLPTAEARLLLHPAFVLAFQGEYDRALKKAAEDTKGRETAGPVLYGLACLHAVAADVADRDSKLSAEERTKLVEERASRAVELLVKAQAAGFSGDAPEADIFKTDADLDCLRQRPDFQKLLKDAKAPEDRDPP